MNRWIWHNGKFRQEDGADIPVFAFADRLRLGHGVFDTMKCVDGVPMYAEQHLRRLFRHAAAFGIQPWKTPEEIVDIIKELLERNELTNGAYAVNTLVTGGMGARGLASLHHPFPTIVIVPAVQKLPETFAPAKVITASVRRNEGSPLSQIKSVNYGDNLLAFQEAEWAGADDALMLNNKGHAACTTTGNLFILKDGKLYTPPLEDGVMDGITRALLIENHAVEIRSVDPAELFKADAVFLTNSIRGIQPIIELDGQTLHTPSDIIHQYPLP